MKALAWVLATLFQITFMKINFFDFLIPTAQFFYDHAYLLIEKHPSPWNWFYEAILIGRDEGLRSRSTLQSFFTLGLYHLIVVSGSHVIALEKIVRTLTFFLPRKAQSFLVVLALALFSLVNRLQASCVRALISWILGQKKSLKPSHNADLQMAVTCLCLCLEPQWATSLSFQLSCGATLGLAIACSLEFKNLWAKRLGTSLMCTLTTAPLIYCVQACLSWLIIPANTIGMPLFEGILMPLSLINIFIRPVSFMTEPIFSFVFGFSDFTARFDHPLLCMDEWRLKAWGLIYIGFVYLAWRWLWPYWLRKQFESTQHLGKAI